MINDIIRKFRKQHALQTIKKLTSHSAEQSNIDHIFYQLNIKKLPKPFITYSTYVRENERF